MMFDDVASAERAGLAFVAAKGIADDAGAVAKLRSLSAAEQALPVRTNVLAHVAPVPSRPGRRACPSCLLTPDAG